MSRVLFVCAGNICRSPIAEHLLRRILRERGIEGIEVASAGVIARDGDVPAARTLRAASVAGLDLSRHRATRFDPSLVREGELVLVMERWQRDGVRAATGLPAERVLLLGSYAPGDEEIADPEDGPDAVFDACVARLEACVTALADTFSKT
jgi:protein-tyrosine-phosphatase